jgi:hypothetical protein
VRVAHRGVGDQHLLLFQHLLREALGTKTLEPVARARRWRLAQRTIRLPRRPRHRAWNRPAFHLRVAVDGDVAEELEQPGCPVAVRGKLKQLRRGVDETGGALAAVNSGCAITFSRNARLLDTPRMRNSRSARSMRAFASDALWPQTVTLTKSES